MNRGGMVMEVVYSVGRMKLMQFTGVCFGPWKVLNLSRSVDWIYTSHKKDNGVEMKHELIFMPQEPQWIQKSGFFPLQEIWGQLKMIKTLVA